jgi:hypothetical protein
MLVHGPDIAILRAVHRLPAALHLRHFGGLRATLYDAADSNLRACVFAMWDSAMLGFNWGRD